MSSKKTSKKKTTDRHTAVPPKAAEPKVTASTPTAAKSAASAPATSPATAQASAKTTASQPTATSTVAATGQTTVQSPEIAAAISALRDGNADTAREAAITLGNLKAETAVDELMLAVRNDDNFYHSVVRAAAAESLGRIGNRRAVSALVRGIDDSMAEASAEAVRALATLGDPSAVAPLINVVRNRDGYYLPIVRRAAVLALAKLGGTEATAELATVAGNSHEDPVVRQAASSSKA